MGFQNKMEVGSMACAYNLSTQKAEQEDCHDFEYTLS